MTKILEIKELLVSYYKEFEKYINPIIKFVFLLVTLIQLNNYLTQLLGTQDITTRMIVMVGVAAISTFIPGSWYIVMLMGVVGYRFFASGYLEATIVVGLSMLVVYLLFVRLFPKMAYFIVLIPLSFTLNLGYVIPIIAGMFFGPSTIVAIGTGILMYKSTDYLPQLLTMTSETLYDIPDTLVAMYKYVMEALTQDTDMVLAIFVFAIVVIVTFVVSQLEFDYIWYIAIGAGGLVNILGFIIGAVMLEVTISAGGVIFGTIIAVLICSFIQFMRFSLDYIRKEKVQFEDEDYYYYVKAIPKIRVAKSEREIKKIK